MDRRWAAQAAVVGAVVLAALGQWLLLAGRGWPGAMVSFIAAALFGLAVRSDPPLRGSNAPPGRPHLPEEAWNAVGAAVLFTVLALMFLDVDNVTLPVWLLQTAAVVSVIAAGWFADRNRRLFAEAGALRRSPIELGAPTARALLALVVVGGAWVRFVDLGSVPRGFWFDEADAGLLARRIADEGFRPIFGGQVPAYDAYLIAGFTEIFGESVAAIRAVSAVFGTAMILAAYLVGRELFGRTGGVIVAFLIAFSRWAITLSRIGMNNVTLPLFVLLALGFLLRGHRRNSYLDLAWAGLAAGAGMLFYPAIASSLLAFAVFALYLVWRSRTDPKVAAAQAAIGAAAAIVITAPLAKFAVIEPDRYFRRNRTTAIWSEAGLLEGDTVASAFAKSLRRYLPMTSFRGDNNGRHNIPGEPMYPPMVSGLSFLALGAVAWRVDRRLSVLAALWIPLAFAPGILSLPWEAPNALRAVGVLPVGLVLATAAVVVGTRALVHSPRTRLLGVALVAAGLAATGWAEVTSYFDANRNDGAVWAVHSTADTIAVELNAAAPPTTDVRVVSFLTNSRQRQFLTPEKAFDQVLGSETPLPVYVPRGSDALILTTREAYDIGAQAERLYPNATVEREFEGLTSDLIAIRIPAGDVAASLGWTDAGDGTFQAALLVDESLDYRLRTAPGQQVMIVDGYDASDCATGVDDVGAEIGLAAGLHLIVVRSTETPDLQWMPAGATDWMSVPAERLVRADLIEGGLLARHWGDPDATGDPDLVEIDASLALRMHDLVLPRPLRSSWTGGLEIIEPGRYEFELRTDDELTLRVDDSVAATNGTEFSEQRFELELDAGIHPIRVDYLDLDGRSEVVLRWRPPSAAGPELVPIPATAFVPWIEPAPWPDC